MNDETKEEFDRLVEEFGDYLVKSLAEKGIDPILIDPKTVKVRQDDTDPTTFHIDFEYLEPTEPLDEK